MSNHVNQGEYGPQYKLIGKNYLADALRRVRRFYGATGAAARTFAKYPLETKLYHGAIIATGFSAIATGIFMLFGIHTIFLFAVLTTKPR